MPSFCRSDFIKGMNSTLKRFDWGILKFFHKRTTTVRHTTLHSTLRRKRLRLVRLLVPDKIMLANSIFTGISSYLSHRLQWVKNSLARVLTRSTANTTSVLTSIHWLPIRQRTDFKLAILVYSTLHNVCPQCLSFLSSTPTLYCVSFVLSPSISSRNPISTWLLWFSAYLPFSFEFPPS